MSAHGLGHVRQNVGNWKVSIGTQKRRSNCNVATVQSTSNLGQNIFATGLQTVEMQEALTGTRVHACVKQVGYTTQLFIMHFLSHALARCIARAGVAEEYVKYGRAEGGLNDVRQLDSLLRALKVGSDR